jgi:hypothetical protein
VKNGEDTRAADWFQAAHAEENIQPTIVLKENPAMQTTKENHRPERRREMPDILKDLRKYAKLARIFLPGVVAYSWTHKTWVQFVRWADLNFAVVADWNTGQELPDHVHCSVSAEVAQGLS